MEQLTSTEMRPTCFQPIARRHFIFCMEGIDQFLVKRVERAPYVKLDKGWKKTDRDLLRESLAHKKLVVYLHDPIAPSALGQITDLIELGGKSQAHIKFLDPVGTVIGGVTFNRVEVDRVDYSPMDYDSNDFSEIKLTLSFNNEERYSSTTLPTKPASLSKAASTVGIEESGECIKQQAEPLQTTTSL